MREVWCLRAEEGEARRGRRGSQDRDEDARVAYGHADSR